MWGVYQAYPYFGKLPYGSWATKVCMPTGSAGVDPPESEADTRLGFFLLTFEAWTAPGLVRHGSPMVAFLFAFLGGFRV